MKRSQQVVIYVVLGIVSLLAIWRIQQQRPVASPAPSVPSLRAGSDASVQPAASSLWSQHMNEVSATDLSCTDPVWCSVPMPAESLFRFPTGPTDPKRWARAQAQAASGEQVLLKRIIKHFPTHLDFLDGDVLFRRNHQLADVFLDKSHDFRAIVPDASKHPAALPKHVYPWESLGKNPVLPVPYKGYLAAGRAPVLKAGYYAFAREGPDTVASPHFMGRSMGEAVVERSHLLELWKPFAAALRGTPYVVLHAANENWGRLSTFFPNRTINWGDCCEGGDLTAFLDHPSLLLYMVNQHHNLTHAKVLSAPRGLPLAFTNNAQIVYDAQRLLLQPGNEKDQLVFLSASTWGYRPVLIKCIQKSFSAADFQHGAYSDNLQGRMGQEPYYNRLGRSRFGLALPGLGYDTFRLWELLTVGSIPVLEKGVGLDRTLWRLPALLVDDFALLTPALLRTAYVEALYRADDWQFARLTQSWWMQLVMNISRHSSSAPLMDAFPPEAQDGAFTRPREPFSCGDGDGGRGCGAGTKRTPSRYC